MRFGLVLRNFRTKLKQMIEILNRKEVGCVIIRAECLGNIINLNYGRKA